MFSFKHTAVGRLRTAVHRGCKICHPNWVIAEAKCTETDLKKSQIFPIWGQSDPIWMPNSKSLTQTREQKLVLLSCIV